MINATQVAADQSWLTYYQVWNNSDYTINYGANGLQRLDYVVNTAGKYGIKVCTPYTSESRLTRGILA
jgi:mannan endo-1,4-beta-mannosidase